MKSAGGRGRIRSRCHRVAAVDLDVPVDDDGPRVQLLPVVHDHGPGLLHYGKDHDSAEGPPDGQRHVGKGSEMLRELEEDLNVVVRPVGWVLLQAFPDSVPHRQALQR